MDRKIFKTVLLFAALSFFIAGVCTAASDVPRISIDALKKLVDDGTGIVILDVQPKAAYDSGHIKGAVSFPWRPKLTEAQVSALPRNKPIVTYCDCGPGESDSDSMAEQLLDMGFKDVKVLQDPSIRGWKKAGYPTE